MQLVYCSFILLLLLNSCGSGTKPSGHYPIKKINAYARYMQQNRELQAEITFRTDSTMKIDGDVLVNDAAMIPKKLPSVGTQYRLVKSAIDFDSLYRFEYTEKDGSLRSLQLQINRFQDPVIKDDKISQNQGGLLYWDGPALESDDGLIMIFTDAKGQSFSINHNGISRGNRFEIVAEYAKRLAKGPASLLITRKKTSIRQEKEQSLLVCIEYYHKAIDFNVTE